MRPPTGKDKKTALLLEAKGERNKIIAMSVLLVLVLIAFFTTRTQEGHYRERELEALPETPTELQAVLAAPEIDAAAIDALVSDATETDRVLLDRAAVEVALSQASTLLDGHFPALNGRELDDLAWRELMADPGGWRGALHRVRGSIEGLWAEEAQEGGLWRGRLKTEGGRTVHFVLRHVPDGLAVGDWVRFDALFVKVFRDEVDGGWLEGPLFAGRRAIASYAPLGKVAELGPYDLLDVTDASLKTAYGGDLEDHPEELYLLLSYARDVAPGVIDWDAAPELTSDTLSDIFENGTAWRGRPVRIPISGLMGITNLAVGENPARMLKVADGWIGNQLWKSSNGLIHFRAPFPVEGFERKDLVTARGFFFMNEKYQPNRGGLSVSSFFVLQDLEHHIPPADHRVRNLMIGVTAVGILICGLVWVGLVRDARRTKELREELVRRRRERSSKTTSTPA